MFWFISGFIYQEYLIYKNEVLPICETDRISCGVFWIWCPGVVKEDPGKHIWRAQVWKKQTDLWPVNKVIVFSVLLYYCEIKIYLTFKSTQSVKETESSINLPSWNQSKFLLWKWIKGKPTFYTVESKIFMNVASLLS